MAAGKKCGDAVDATGLQGFLGGHAWHDGREGAGQQGLAAARRPDHQEVVPASRRHLKGALGVFLPLHVADVGTVISGGGCQELGLWGKRFDAAFPLEMGGQAAQRLDRIGLDPLNQRGLGCVDCRDVGLGEALLRG